MDLTDADVTDILALLDSLPYDEFDLETSSFRLILRRTPGGWTQSAELRSAPAPLPPASPPAAGSGGAAEAVGAGEAQAGEAEAPPDGVDAASAPSIGADGTSTPTGGTGAGADGASGVGGTSGAGTGIGRGDMGIGRDDTGELVAVRAPLPGTFYRAPRPGAAPFVEVGSRVSAETVIGIVETMKLMNSVPAGVAGTVAEFCVGNAEFAAQGATLLRIRADR